MHKHDNPSLKEHSSCIQHQIVYTESYYNIINTANPVGKCRFYFSLKSL